MCSQSGMYSFDVTRSLTSASHLWLKDVKQNQTIVAKTYRNTVAAVRIGLSRASEFIASLTNVDFDFGAAPEFAYA